MDELPGSTQPVEEGQAGPQPRTADEAPAPQQGGKKHKVFARRRSTEQIEQESLEKEAAEAVQRASQMGKTGTAKPKAQVRVLAGQHKCCYTLHFARALVPGSAASSP